MPKHVLSEAGTNPEPVRSAVEVASRLVSVLVSEQRESTYKEAFVLGLIQECALSEGRPRVSLLAIADRFIDVYWQQLTPFPDRAVLRQVRKGSERIPRAIRDLKTASTLPNEWRPGRPRTQHRYRVTQRRIAQLVAQQPATHLQNPGGRGGVGDFLFDSSWLWDKVTLKSLDEHAWTLELLPGVADALLMTEPLLVPVIQRLWEEDLRRFNAVLAPDRQLSDFLFGDDRVALTALRTPLFDAQQGQCFYCARRLPSDFHVDHVIPWSRSGLNDLANLVAVDPRCNVLKSDALPTMDLVKRAVSREFLPRLSAAIDWELNPPRVLAVAIALHSAAPAGTRLWAAGRQWLEKNHEDL